jgi:hypothetical protein
MCVPQRKISRRSRTPGRGMRCRPDRRESGHHLHASAPAEEPNHEEDQGCLRYPGKERPRKAGHDCDDSRNRAEEPNQYDGSAEK